HSFIGILHTIALSDGNIHPSELSILRTAESYLRLPSGTVDQLLGSSGKSISECYSILDCSPDMTNEEIKSAYRVQCKKFHSDHLQSKGLPEEFIQFANSQLILVRNAYETIFEERGV
ncbi:MAG: DnaJ domain-containing protein, partial [Candidatus Heimdallarchaeaceae archaeon]